MTSPTSKAALRRKAFTSGQWPGTVDLLLRCLPSMRAHGQILRFDPAIPPQIKRLRFSVHYRGYRVELVFSADHLGVSSRPGPAAPVTVLIPSTPLSCARARGIPSH